MNWPETDGITIDYFPETAIPDQYQYYFETLFGSSASHVAGGLDQLTVWVGRPPVAVAGVCDCDGYGQGPTIEDLAKTTWVHRASYQHQVVKDFFVVDVVPRPYNRPEAAEVLHVVGARCIRCGRARLWFEAPVGVSPTGRWINARTLGLWTRQGAGGVLDWL